MSRRQFGSVRRLPSGRWQARYRGPAGRLVAAPHTFATRGDATRWLATVEVDQARGHWLDPTAGHVHLSDYAWAWLRDKPRLAPRTREIYDLQLRLHILPEVAPGIPPLGDFYLSDLTPELVRAWYSALATGRSASIAAKAYTRLRQILNQAVMDDRIPKNPCRIPGGGAERHPEQRFLSIPELYRLADAVPSRYRALILTAGFAGLRQGELFALRWADVDFSRAVIVVRRKRQRLASGEVIEGDPKSAAGRRTVAIPEPLVEELRDHLGQQADCGLDAYVFTSEAGLPIDADNFRSRIWRPATKRAGLAGLRFHDLRHTAGTLAAQTGATTKELMARLGHASPRAALIYQHASEDRDRLIADRLADMTRRSKLVP